MSPARFDRRAIDAFLDAAAERLEGEWVLVGGSAAAAWFLASRVTEDIDLIPLDATSAQRLALLELAEERGLPVESVNSAADFFLRKIDGWRDEIVVLRQGRATLYRPSATLFLLLKLGRLSQSDLGDCLALLSSDEASDLDRARVLLALDGLPPAGEAALGLRREALRQALAG